MPHPSTPPFSDARAPKEELRDFARRRVGLVLGASALGLVVASADGEAPKGIDELALAMGAAMHGVVRPADVRWEPSRGIVGDLVFGRFALFLASEEEGGPRDLYRATVRLSPEGRPLAVSGVHNLTSTPLGDDHALVVRGMHAAYATFAFGQEQSVTGLDLSGEGAQNVTKKWTDRAMAWVTNVQRTGAGEGIGRVDVTLEPPAHRVGLGISPAGDALEIALADDDVTSRPTRTARLDLDRGELTTTAEGIRAQAGTHLPKKLSHWGVDTVRAVPWIGPAPITWLEEKVFAASDVMKRLKFKIAGSGQDLASAPDEPPPPSVLDASQAGVDLGHWPPPAIRSIWKTPEAGEGEWQPPKQPWIKKLAAPQEGEAPPSPFYQTFVRPDEERPYAKVLLVAMDMRQLDLDMEAGSEDPKPLTGPPGTGRIPRDPAVYTRIAAAWNGGFKTEHGAYGMMLKKRVLLPPMPGIATVIVTKDQRVGLGSWGTNKDVGGIIDVEGSDIVSFRQNLDPLLDNDKVNPLGRTQWGFTLPGTGMQTERSGICVTNAGHLMYAWGDDASATSLGKAMKMAGCVYGMHLDMNPHHTGFIYTNITELKGKAYKSELISPQMEIDTDRYILYAPKDFFYVTLHDGTPPPLEPEGKRVDAKGDAGAADPARTRWEPDLGVQPAPAWMPGLWRASVDDVELLEIEPGRASFRVRAGTKEPDAKTGAPRAHELSEDDAHRVLFAVTLGASEAKRHRGLVTDGKVALPMVGGAHLAALVAGEDGQLSIVPSKEGASPASFAGSASASARTDVVELPLLLDDGKVTVPHATRAPAALGLGAHGRTYLARARGAATAEDLAAILKRAGCTRAVLLDRGAGVHGAVFRAGTSNPPRARYEETTLYAMGRALLPRGFRFEAAHPVRVEAPKKK